MTGGEEEGRRTRRRRPGGREKESDALLPCCVVEVLRDSAEDVFEAAVLDDLTCAALRSSTRLFSA